MGWEADRRRSSPRVELRLDVTLARAHGNPIPTSTQDIGPTGMRLTAPRPLGIDERFSFEVGLDGMPVTGHARVVREHLPGVYALRFEDLAPGGADALWQLVAPPGPSQAESKRC